MFVILPCLFLFLIQFCIKYYCRCCGYSLLNHFKFLWYTFCMKIFVAQHQFLNIWSFLYVRSSPTSSLFGRQRRVNSRHCVLDNIGREPQDPAQAALETHRRQEVAGAGRQGKGGHVPRWVAPEFPTYLAPRTSHHLPCGVRRITA